MQDKPIPFSILLCARIFNPVQGAFNILVYCRPHVTSYRKRNPGCSWIKAFLKTLENGGDSYKSEQDDVTPTSKKSRRLARIEHEHLKRMQSIRRSIASNEIADSVSASNKSMERERLGKNDSSRNDIDRNVYGPEGLRETCDPPEGEPLQSEGAQSDELCVNGDSMHSIHSDVSEVAQV